MEDPAENRRRLQAAFEAMTHGDFGPFRHLMSDDVCWEVTGSGRWSGRWSGKAEVWRELLGGLARQFAQPFVYSTFEIVAAQDEVVVLIARGHAVTRRGLTYDNRYCFVCRFAGGRLGEVVEYADTALGDRVLEPPFGPAPEPPRA